MRLTTLLAEMGVHDVRLTGGEPLVRRDFPRLAAHARRGPRRRGPLGHDERLPARARRRGARARGHQPLQRLDRLAAARPLLRDDPPRRAAARAARPRGARAVPRGAPDQGQRRRDARLHRAGGAPVRRVRPLAPLRGALHRVHAARRRPRLDAGQRADAATRSARRSAPSTRSRPSRARPHATARVYRFADGNGRIGFINPVSEPFCGDCNRIRLTADGKLRTCLFSLNETDLRAPLRDGASDDDVEQIIRDAVWRKELKHRVNDAGFVQPARSMSAIGG